MYLKTVGGWQSTPSTRHYSFSPGQTRSVQTLVRLFEPLTIKCFVPMANQSLQCTSSGGCSALPPVGHSFPRKTNTSTLRPDRLKRCRTRDDHLPSNRNYIS